MWFCFSDAFLSIVAHKNNAELLLVRARRPGDIENVFPEASVIKTPGYDYLFRAELPRHLVAQVISETVLKMRATNFKDSVGDQKLHQAYMDVWDRMAELQPIPPYGDRDSAGH